MSFSSLLSDLVFSRGVREKEVFWFPCNFLKYLQRRSATVREERKDGGSVVRQWKNSFPSTRRTVPFIG